MTLLYIDNSVYTPFIFAVTGKQCIQERANYSRAVILVALSPDAVYFPDLQVVDFSRGRFYTFHIVSKLNIHDCKGIYTT